MRELKSEEVEQVGGSFGLTVAAIGFGAALVGKLGFAGSVGAWAVASVGLIVGTMGLANEIGNAAAGTTCPVPDDSKDS